MKHLLLITVLAISGWASQAKSQVPSPSPSAASPPTPANQEKDQGHDQQKDRRNDQENSRKARALLDQAIQALGGQPTSTSMTCSRRVAPTAFITDSPPANGVLFLAIRGVIPTKNASKYEAARCGLRLHRRQRLRNYLQGTARRREEDLEDYLRHRRVSLETVLRTWINDPGVALFFDGNALAAISPRSGSRSINSKNDAVSLFFDIDTHLPIKKSYTWRDPVDRERNVEEEIYDNYRLVQGVMIRGGLPATSMATCKASALPAQCGLTKASTKLCSIPTPVTIQ